MLFRPMIMRDTAHGGPIYFDEDMGIPEVWLDLDDATEIDLRPWAAERLGASLAVVEHAVGFLASFEGEPTAYVQDGEILPYGVEICARCGAYEVEAQVRHSIVRPLCGSCAALESQEEGLMREEG